MKNILFIHQSAEMYGSDKTLLLLVKNLDKTKFFSTVVLPNEGPLKTELESQNIKVVIAPVLKLYRKMFIPKNILSFFKDIRQGYKTLDSLNKTYSFDLVYSNTLAVLLGLFYAKSRNIKHLWHVHEIIESPKLFTKVFLYLMQLKANSSIVYNSNATAHFWNVNDKIKLKSTVISNGLEIPITPLSSEKKQDIRLNFFKSNSSEVVIALVGRISRWKGQLFLLNAFSEILKTNVDIKLVFIGSPPPNQDNFLVYLQDQIAVLKVTNKVVLIPFHDQIFDLWQSIDIAVVPSIEPEPFGLVAVEAMLAKKPVIGSNHGGLSEIIVNNETGFLVEPNNELELSKALKKLIDSKQLRDSLGENGYQRAVKKFSVDKYVSKFETLFEN